MRGMRIPTRPLLLAFVSIAAACGEAPSAGKQLPELARAILGERGLDGWRRLEKLEFTWKHVPSGRVRSYAWSPGERTVTVTMAVSEDRKATATIPSDELPPDASDLDRTMHEAFVNDVYWFAIEFMMLQDGSTLRDLGERPLPGGFADLPATARALEVNYPPDEGYTGGDRYVLYVKDAEAIAWAFHRGGAKEPTLITTREQRVDFDGVSLPTRFKTPDGKTFIEITNPKASFRN